MAEVKWFKSVNELKSYAKAEARGQNGEEFKPKVLVEPEKKKKTKKGKEND